MEEKNKLKIAVISGASHAMDYKEKNPKALPSEVIRHVTDNADEIISKIDVEEEL